MLGKPTGFWGKLSVDGAGNVDGWHPLTHHCLDVAACCEFLLRQTDLGRRFWTLAGLEGTPPHHGRICILAGLHDAGKFNIGFQKRWLNPGKPGAGHVGEVLNLFESDGEEVAEFAEAISFPRIAAWGVNESVICELLAAAICHHGKPVQPKPRSNPAAWRSWRGLEPFAGMADLFAHLSAAFPRAFEDTAPFFDDPSLQHALCGLVTLADWLGSDTRFFPYSEAPHDDRLAFARKRVADAATGIGLDIREARKALPSTCPGFDQIWQGYQPRQVQECILTEELCPDAEITIMEADTGSGKTEAALYHFLRLFHAGHVDGLYFALPTRTSAIQLYDRVRSAASVAFGGDAPPVVLAVPGYLAVDGQEGRRLAPFEVLWGDERYRARGWAAEHPKRYLASAIAVGTVDQLLFSALMVSHSHMRAVCSLRHLLVVDEVHASDAYMTELLRAVLQRHCRAGGHALLMSATLGSAAAARLSFPDRKNAVPHLPSAESLQYPALRQFRQRDGQVRSLKPSDSPGSKRVLPDLKPCAAVPADIASLAADAAQDGAKVIILRNTVSDAVATQRALEERAGGTPIIFSCNGLAAPHHSRFGREDRSALDRALQQRFGKVRSAGGCVVVATQTIQQSLDLDADWMITDLCPMDVLLQRMGRLHRHYRPDEERPPRFRQPRLTVLIPETRDLGDLLTKGGRARGSHGFGTVYDDLRILEATWRLLENETALDIPRMNRYLVEHATHPDVLERIGEELGDAWREHSATVFVSRVAERQTAGLNLLDWARRFGRFEFPSPATDEQAPSTRLGLHDRIVRFEEPVPALFSEQTQTLLTMPHFMAPEDAPEDGVACDVRIEPACVRFGYGARRYRYDRLGLRRDDESDSANVSKGGVT